MSDETHGVRLDRVEVEVTTIRNEMGGLKSDMSGLKSDVRGLGSILGRIEQGVSQAQQQFIDREQASRPNMVAVMGVLITLISIIVGGAWLISGQLATTATQMADQEKSIDRMIGSRDRELDRIQSRVDRLEHGGGRVIASEAR